MRGVCRTIPTDLIKLIGRAPRVGRPRWGGLVKAFAAAESRAAATVRRTLAADKVAGLSSDERFARVTAALAGGPERLQEDEVALEAAGGRAVGKAVFTGGQVRFVVNKAQAQAFAEFLRAELPTLMERFDVGNGATEHPTQTKNPVT